MSEWTQDDPGAGDMASLRTRMAKLAIQRNHALEMQTLVGTQEAQVATGWTGTGHEAWSLEAAQTAVGWSRLHTWADNEYNALDRYIDAVESIKSRAAHQKSLLAAAQFDYNRTTLTQQSTTSSTEPTPTVSGDEPSAAQASLRASQTAATTALHALAVERQQADDDLTASVHEADVPLNAAGKPALPAGLTVSGLAQLSTSDLLSTLGALSATDLAQLLEADPSLTQTFWNHPPPASDVAAWWSSMSDDQRVAVTAGAPSIIGNLGGVPYAIRDTANRNTLALAKTRTDLTEDQTKTLKQIDDSLRPGDKVGAVTRGLTDLNLDSKPPLAAVAVGDLDTADKITWAVPGMENTTSGSMEAWTTASANLGTEQMKQDGASTHAVVAWIGYKTPALKKSFTADSVLSNALAQRGANRLAAELDSVHTTRAASGDPLQRLSVTSHSYGTTTTAYALTKTHFDVDSVTFVASAGIDSSAVPNATALNVKENAGVEQVYSSQASRDVVATVGRDVNPGWVAPYVNPFGGDVVDNHRIYPDTTFGAIRYSSNGYDVGSEHYLPTGGHDALGSGGKPVISAPKGEGYFDTGTESLHNMAVTTTGTGTLLTVPYPSPSPGPVPVPAPH